MRTNVFCDLHHSGLFYSFKLLFENRLGMNLFRPIGTEWFDKGFWNIAEPYGNNINTVNQYLSLDSRFTPVDGTPLLNKVIETKPSYYVIDELEHEYQQKAITFEQFQEMDIDIIIASIPQHWVTYRKLRDKQKPKAKLIAHMGNMFNEVFRFMELGAFDNLMASTIDFPVPPKLNHVFYHQEQPLVDFVPPDPKNRNIKSFVHLLPKVEQFVKYAESLPDFHFQAFGAGTPNGWLSGIRNIYKQMQESQYVYHVKPRGDGYGWDWHSAFLVGRPILTNFSDYAYCLGGKLFEDRVTGFNLEARTVQENCELIRKALVGFSDQYNSMAWRAYERFREIVNYNEEEIKLRKFINTLQ